MSEESSLVDILIAIGFAENVASARLIVQAGLVFINEIVCTDTKFLFSPDYLSGKTIRYGNYRSFTFAAAVRSVE